MEHSSCEVIKIIEADGWYEVACVGSHHHFKHPTKIRTCDCAASEAKDSDWNRKKHFQTGGHKPGGEEIMKNEYAFIAVLEYAEDGINISFPDLPGCFSCADANNTEEAIRNAKEALGLHLFGMEQDDEKIPEPRPLNAVELEKNCVPALIDVFMPSVRVAVKTSFVKKTLSLPAWLAALADEKKVNCSKIFQDALKAFLGVEEPKSISIA